MCGIGGAVSLDKRKHFSEQLQLDTFTLLMRLQNRGTHAWGVWIEKAGKRNNKLYCGKYTHELDGELFKTPGSVTKFFTEDDGTVDLAYTHTILMHTRSTTQGNSEVNDNNHPFYSKDFVLAHNGMIRNDDTIKKKYKIKTTIETDSFVILALIQHFYEKGKSVTDSIREMSKVIQGNYACWLYDRKKKELYLFRNSTTTPMHYYFDDTNNVFMFASESEHIVQAYASPGTVTNDAVKEVTIDGIYKLNGHRLELKGKLDTYVFTSDTPTSPSRPASNIYSANQIANTEKINASLVNLYRVFEKYDTDSTDIKTIISIVENDIILLVKSKGLIQVLDKCGFKDYKQEAKVYNTDFYKYTITPMDNLNSIVSRLMIGVSTGNTPLLTQSENEVETHLENKPLHEALKDLAETIGCEYKYVHRHYVFVYPGRNEVPQDTIRLFKKQGLKFKKSNVLKLNDTEYHRERLVEILVHMNLYKKEA